MIAFILAAVYAALAINLIALATIIPKVPGPRRKGNTL